MAGKPCIAGPWGGDEMVELGSLWCRVLLSTNGVRGSKIAIPSGRDSDARRLRLDSVRDYIQSSVSKIAKIFSLSSVDIFSHFSVSLNSNVKPKFVSVFTKCLDQSTTSQSCLIGVE